MILRWSTLLWLAACTVAVGLMFQIKHAVQDLEDQLARTQAAIHRDREAVHVLRAEWSYLNRPERIARLAEKHLEMLPLTAPNISRISALPPRPEDMDGRVFAAGPPVPPRRPDLAGEGWHELLPLPQPDAGPSRSRDPIGALVAATLAESSPVSSSAASPPPPAVAPGPVVEPQPRRRVRDERDVPRNPVTGAPLPVDARFVSESR